MAKALGKHSLPEPGKSGGIGGRIMLMSDDREDDLATISEVLDHDPANDGWMVVRLPGV